MVMLIVGDVLHEIAWTQLNSINIINFISILTYYNANILKNVDLYGSN